MRIVLIGYRGSGKTSVGRLVAERLKLAFADVDDRTCARFNIDSIAEIWQRYGEKAWRRTEAQVARELCGQDNMVIGLGGGTLMQPAARDAVERCDALRVYLKAPPQVLAARIAQDPRSGAARPNLTAHGGVEEVRQVLAQRHPVYEAVADEVIDADRLSIEEAADRIVMLARRRMKKPNEHHE